MLPIVGSPRQGNSPDDEFLAQDGASTINPAKVSFAQEIRDEAAICILGTGGRIQRHGNFDRLCRNGTDAVGEVVI